jgi:hypothetical protein
MLLDLAMFDNQVKSYVALSFFIGTLQSIALSSDSQPFSDTLKYDLQPLQDID